MKKIKNILLALIAIIGGTLIITEAFGPHMYWVNAIYLCCILPACIGCSDICETMRPDLYGCKKDSKENDR